MSIRGGKGDIWVGRKVMDFNLGKATNGQYMPKENSVRGVRQGQNGMDTGQLMEGMILL